MRKRAVRGRRQHGGADAPTYRRQVIPRRGLDRTLCPTGEPTESRFLLRPRGARQRHAGSPRFQAVLVAAGAGSTPTWRRKMAASQ